jgi:hypothetical protein
MNITATGWFANTEATSQPCGALIQQTIDHLAVPFDFLLLVLARVEDLSQRPKECELPISSDCSLMRGSSTMEAGVYIDGSTPCKVNRLPMRGNELYCLTSSGRASVSSSTCGCSD